MTFWFRSHYTWVLLSSIGLLLFPALCSAEGFVQLVGIPTAGGVAGGQITDTQTYLNALYSLSIAVAAFLAVVKLIFAGVQYALSGIVTTKESAKNDIKGAVLGLLIVLGAVLILQEINPRLTDFTLFQNVPTAPRQERSVQADTSRIECVVLRSDGTCGISPSDTTALREQTGIAVDSETLIENFILTADELRALSGVLGAEASLAVTQNLNAQQQAFEANNLCRTGSRRDINRSTGVVTFICAD